VAADILLVLVTCCDATIFTQLLMPVGRSQVAYGMEPKQPFCDALFKFSNSTNQTETEHKQEKVTLLLDMSRMFLFPTVLLESGYDEVERDNHRQFKNQPPQQQQVAVCWWSSKSKSDEILSS
jgi:hypothetical protein